MSCSWNALSPLSVCAAGTPDVADGQVEHRRTRGEGVQERLLLGAGDVADPGEAGVHLRIGRLHRVSADREQLGEGRLLHAEQPHRADHPPQQPAQDVPAGLVAGADPVVDQHQPGPDVVGDHPKAYVVRVVRAVRLARDLGGAGDDREDLVDLVQVVDPLQQVGRPLQPHPGVDVLPGQVADHVEVVLGPDRGQLLLHEDQVPDLQEPVLVDDRAAVRTELRPTVDVDLAARAAGTGDAHVPVVVEQTAALDPLLRQPGDAAPERGRLVVGLQHGHPDLVGVEAEEAGLLCAGDQLPGVADRLGLEIVAEGEVAVHLEERAVPGGLADLLDVEGPDALLDARGAVERRLFDAGEVRLERDHAGVHEQQGRVVVEQRRARHDFVPTRGVEVEEPAPDLGGFHLGCSLRLMLRTMGAGRSSPAVRPDRTGRALRGLLPGRSRPHAAPPRARPWQLEAGRRSPGTDSLTPCAESDDTLSQGLRGRLLPAADDP